MEYLVELSPGREVVYDSPVALRAALRRREITGDSRIYHRTAACWLSIMEHPEYRKLLSERRPPDWLEPIPYQPEPTGHQDGASGLVPGMLERVRGVYGAVGASLTAGLTTVLKRAHVQQVEPAGSSAGRTTADPELTP